MSGGSKCGGARVWRTSFGPSPARRPFTLLLLLERIATIPAPAPALDALGFDAVIFDMDGVITRTASVHAQAWRQMFDEFLQYRAERFGEPFQPFVQPRDYLAHVDGRPRYQGVETFLHSRGVALPHGASADLPGFATACALGNLKNALFNRIVAEEGVGLYDSSVALIRDLLARGIRVGLATSSRNAAMILERTRTAALFEAVVDGLVSERLGLRGKPEPDIFAAACAQLGVERARTVIVEDAASGVQAGARGGFALTLGVAREDNARELREHGADWVVADLAGTSPEELSRLVRARRET